MAAIPGYTSPTPKQSQVFFKPGAGLSTRTVAVPRKELQLSGGTASTSNSFIAAGSGSTTVPAVLLTGTKTYTANVVLSIPTPMTTTVPTKLVLGAPTVNGITGMTITTIYALPQAKLGGTTLLIGAGNLGAGQTVQQFVAAVTFVWTGGPAVGSTLTVSCSGSLVTT